MHFALILVSLAAVLSLSSALSVPILGCQAAFNATFSTATDAAKQCTALDVLNKCMTGIITAASADQIPDMLAQSFGYLATAFAKYTLCNEANLTFFSSDSNIALHLAGGSDVNTVKYTRKSIGIKDLRARVASQLTARSEGRTKLLDIINDQIELARDFDIRYDEVVDAVYDPLISQVSSRLGAVNSAASSIQAAAASVGAAASAARTSLNQQVASEATIRASLSSSISASVSSARSSLIALRNAGTADLSSMRASKTANSPLTTITAQISSALSAEVSTAAVKLANQTIIMSSAIPAAASTSIAPLLAAEKSRAEAKCATSIVSGGILFSSAPNQPATNEYSSCTGSDGAFFYSTLSKTVFACNGAVYVPMIPIVQAPFAGSSVLSSVEMRYNMRAKVDPASTWIRCYNLATMGNAVATFRNACNGKGLAHLAVTVSTSGYIFGGYANIPFRSTSGTIYPTSLDYSSFTFRRNPGAPSDSFEAIFDYSGNARTADEASWGPCWSWQYYGSQQYQPLCWNYGNMEYTYTGYYDYYNCAHDLNFACGNNHYRYWLSQDYNPRLAQMEVWYRV